MASTYLSRTFTSNSVSNRKFTYSFWIKRSGLGECTMTSAYQSGTYFAGIKFLSDNRFELYDYRGSYILQKITSRKFRDTNAWYHIVVASDTSVSTPDTKIYINGIEETAFDTDTDYNQNASTSFNHSYNNTIGAFGGSSYQQYVNGLMSHFHFCDGYTYQASDFGSTDTTTGEWKITTSPSVSYGSNGFFILKNGNSVTDQSGNSNNWTVGGGTLTNTEDNPSNVFATLNALDNFYVGGTFSNGNTTVATDVTKYAGTYSTIGASSGKYYCEMKKISGNAHARFGILSRPPIDNGANSAPGNSADSVGYFSSTGDYYISSSATSYGATYGNGDIIGVAMDLDNNKLYFSKNGTWQNSGDPTSGATGTGAINIPTATTGYYHFAMGDQHDAESGTYSINFGNGYFGTTAVSSAGTNASGIGIFEYDVPTGYTALSTKGLNE